MYRSAAVGLVRRCCGGGGALRLGVRQLVVLLLLIALLLYSSGFWFACPHTNSDKLARDAGPAVAHDSDLLQPECSSVAPEEPPEWALQRGRLEAEQRGKSDCSLHSIPCIVNDELQVDCRRQGSAVFVPFSFIKHYFEIYGGLEERDGSDVLSWQHSLAKTFSPRGTYSPHGPFMNFEFYNVPIRDRVKCISGIEGVPLSTQWGPHGYFYPIQIAQYGLSHYSKYLADSSRTSTVIEDAEGSGQGGGGSLGPGWSVPGDARVEIVQDPEAASRVVEFNTADSWSHAGARLSLSSNTEFHLALDLRFSSNGSLHVHVQPKGKQPPTYTLRYVLSDTLIAANAADNSIVIGIGRRDRWSHLTRDLSVDFMKGLNVMYSELGKHDKPKLTLHKVVCVVFRGHGWVDNVTLASNAHLAHFYYAANWMVLHQDEKGGWPINVSRKLTAGIPELAPGWYSAMAQGHAISLLVRAYVRTKNSKYLDTALKATSLYSVDSQKGGVRASFMGQYVWYEEYPTTPSSFVLNGFIYSLLGLYDLKTVAPGESGQQAARLFADGMRSLRALLPLYDTGSGSVYDLRHVALGAAPNLARWDYHATHVTQLLLLATIAESESERDFFSETADRWMGYMKGKRASHN